MVRKFFVWVVRIVWRLILAAERRFFAKDDGKEIRFVFAGFFILIAMITFFPTLFCQLW